MNRAILERLRSFQPSPGLAAPPRPSAFNLGFWIFAACIVIVVVWPAMMLVNCTPADVAPALEVGEGAGEYGTKITACYLKVRDGGTVRDFQKCACDVDRQYQLDASSAGAVCGP